MPDNPLRYTSVYVLASESGSTLIDAGWDSGESWAALSSGLAGIGASTADVNGYLMTHQHVDHIGLAGGVRAPAGWIGMHPVARDAILRPDLRGRELAVAADVTWVLFLGAPTTRWVRLRGNRSRFDPRSTFALPDRLVKHGEDIEIPGWSLRAVHTPGHTPGRCASWRSSAGCCSPVTTCCRGSPGTPPPTEEDHEP